MASTRLIERRECKEEKEPLEDIGLASAIVGRRGVSEDRFWGRSDDCSVGSLSSATASSSTADGTLSAGASDKVKPR